MIKSIKGLREKFDNPTIHNESFIPKNIELAKLEIKNSIKRALESKCIDAELIYNRLAEIHTENQNAIYNSPEIRDIRRQMDELTIEISKKQQAYKILEASHINHEKEIIEKNAELCENQTSRLESVISDLSREIEASNSKMNHLSIDRNDIHETWNRALGLINRKAFSTLGMNKGVWTTTGTGGTLWGSGIPGSAGMLGGAGVTLNSSTTIQTTII